MSVTVKTGIEATNMMFASSSRDVNSNGFYEKEGHRVNEQWMINLPMLGEVKISGFTLTEVEQAVITTFQKCSEGRGSC